MLSANKVELENEGYKVIKAIAGNACDGNWGPLLAPAPMGITYMSQLMICASRIEDINLDKSGEKFPLIRHPESFRTTLVQISNDAYDAFRKAHSNMEKIQFQMVQVPGYFNDSLKIIKTNNKVAIAKLLPLRLDRIEETAKNGEILSKEVSENFENLMKLINQVLEALPLSIERITVNTRQSIEDAIKQEKKRQEDAKEKEQKYLEEERTFLEKSSRKAQENLNAERSRSRNLLEFVFFPNEKNNKIQYKQQVMNDVEQRLTQAKKEAAKLEEDFKKIEMEFNTSLNEITVKVGEKIENDQAVQLLKKGIEQLSKMQQSWDGIARYFQTINNIISTVTRKKFQDFTNVANAIIEDASLIEFLSSSDLQSACGMSHLLLQISEMYVKVSNTYIMNNVAGMQRMIALPDHQVESAQKQLVVDGKKAFDGISQMVMTDTLQLIQDMEDYKEHQSTE